MDHKPLLQRAVRVVASLSRTSRLIGEYHRDRDRDRDQRLTIAITEKRELINTRMGSNLNNSVKISMIRGEAKLLVSSNDNDVKSETLFSSFIFHHSSFIIHRFVDSDRSYSAL